MKDINVILEFDIIKKQLQDHARTFLAKEKVNGLNYSKKEESVKINLAETSEALNLVYAYSTLAFDYVYNIFPHLEKATKGVTLTPKELYECAILDNAIISVKSYFKEIDMLNYPRLNSYVKELKRTNSLKESIFKAINDNYEIFDNASSELRQIRRTIKTKEIEIRKKLNQIIQSKAEYLAETIITIRNDKLVIPIKNTYKNKVSGIIHDYSDSAQTIYIEPSAVANLSYEIAILKQDEKREIERILKELTNYVFENRESLFDNLHNLTHLDFLFAKASYGKKLDASIPCILDKQVINLKKARHPLLNQNIAVANTFEMLDEQKRILLITGPNTGGKTVALKTVGLLALMAQSGLALPVSEGSQIGVFKDIYADIGDDQSIENSLSTFSSHLAKLIEITKNADEKSLILIDEIGAGTNPSEGEAIAMALLDYFAYKNSLVITTTHYSNLKSYALDKGNVLISAMEFNLSDLKPTYRLLNNVFGRSYAFEISKNLGLGEKIVDSAVNYRNFYSNKVILLSEKLEDEKNALIQKEKEFAEEKKDFENKKEKLEKLERKIKNKEKQLEETSKEIIDALVDEAKEEINKIKAELLGNKNAKLHDFIEGETKLRNLFKEDEEIHETKEFKVDDYVMIISLQRRGKIVRKNKEDYVVDLAGMSVSVKGSDLEHTKKVQETKNPSMSVRVGNVAVPLELNLIGLRVMEALPILEKYLDDALALRYDSVRVVHGLGSGKLREAVHKVLDTKKYIVSYRLGGEGEGGLGATVIKLK